MEAVKEGEGLTTWQVAGQAAQPHLDSSPTTDKSPAPLPILTTMPLAQHLPQLHAAEAKAPR